MVNGCRFTNLLHKTAESETGLGSVLTNQMHHLLPEFGGTANCGIWTSLNKSIIAPAFRFFLYSIRYGSKDNRQYHTIVQIVEQVCIRGIYFDSAQQWCRIVQ